MLKWKNNNMLKVEFDKKAKQDLSSIMNYIFDDNPQASVAVLQKIRKSISQIAIFPYIGKTHNDRLREFIESKYKYRIIYQVDEKEAILYIVAIFKHKNTY